MSVLDLTRLAGATVAQAPYPHFVAHDVIALDAAASLAGDFPRLTVAGTVDADEIIPEGAFADLLDELRGAEVAVLMSEKLGLDLTTRPVFINFCKWSKSGDGRIHTDSAAKLATLLIYLTPHWDEGGPGCFRVLRGEKDFDDYACEIRPALGNAVGFRRRDRSWHGFKPFIGERRMVQTTWLLDDRKLAHKRRLGRRAAWLRRLNPFRKTG